MADPITVNSEDVRDILDGDADDSYGIEIRLAEAIVNDDLRPAASTNVTADRLELVGALIAAAYAKDDGDGNLSSITQGSAQISFDNDNALSFWRRAKQLDPTGVLATLEKPTASFEVY
ncbi:hypothetical protein [Halalkalicoccus sp. NIPERK01]|uniref:hypothetical protein n=1 Tax=Halalkalicoccus sp. NIPERK01 TaxID=3053469 RepID=UPI00256EF322|nr:hypothetical protein [Halalkalicoccus sp. NIPERK01]MDL5361355.1 hypothetical protein [Halalkalicoccus sp. NIPERK01]